MASLTLMDEMYKDLLALYPNPSGTKSQSIQDLLKRFYADHPEAYPRGSNDYLNYIRGAGAVGKSHADAEYDFWKNDLYGGGGTVTPPPGGVVLGPTLKLAKAVWHAGAWNPYLQETLKDLSGSGIHMKFGATSVPCVVDGTCWHPLSNTEGPRISNSYADLSITNDIEMMWYGRLESVLPRRHVLMSKFNGVGNTGYLFQTNAAQTAIELVIGIGASTVTATSTPVDLSSFVDCALKVTRVRSTGTVRFEKAPKPTGPWTLISEQVLNAGTAISINTQSLSIGHRTDSAVDGCQGRTSAFWLKSGVTVIADTSFAGRGDGTSFFYDVVGKRVEITPVRSAVVKGLFECCGVPFFYGQSPHQIAFNGGYDVELAVQCAATQWVSAVTQTMFSRWDIPLHWVWAFKVQADGTLRLEYSTTGGASLFATSTVPVTANGAVDKTMMWFRVERVASTGVTKFFTAPASPTEPVGAAWTQLGANVATTPGNIYSGMSNIQVGVQAASTTPFNGWIKRCTYRKVIGGALQFDLDFSVWPEGVGRVYPHTDLTGKPVIINSTASPGADSGDPIWLKYDSTPGSNAGKGMFLPAVNSNSMYVANANVPVITGDMTIEAELAPISWKSVGTIIGKWGVAPNTSYRLEAQASGILRFVLTFDGTAVLSYVATVPISAVDGQRLWVRFYRQSSTGVAWFGLSYDGVNWEPIGASVATTPGVIYNSNASLEIGSSGNGFSSLLAARFFHARLWDAVPVSAFTNPPPGNLVFDVDFSTFVEPLLTPVNAATGQPVIVTRSTTGRKTTLVDRSMFLFGGDDYMESFDHPLFNVPAAGSFSVAVARRNHGFGGGLMITKRNGIAVAFEAGWDFWTDTTPSDKFETCDGTNNMSAASSGSTPSKGMAQTAVAVRNTSNDTVSASTDKLAFTVATDNTNLSLSNTAIAPRISRGGGPGGANYGHFEFFGAAFWETPLSQAQADALDAEFGTNV